MATINDEAVTTGGAPSRGWLVTWVGMRIDLALGVLYSWSVVSKAIPGEWGWSEAGPAPG